MKILLVEDEPKTAQFIKQGLEESSYQVDVATDGLQGEAMALTNQYQLVITDLVLPRMDGREMCKALRQAKLGIPILMLTALGTTEEVVAGFESGADDYLVKPFEFRELLVRIKALLKRTKFIDEAPLLRAADLIVDTSSRVVKRGNHTITLTAKEFALLEYFLQHQGKVISRAELAKNIWKVDFDTGTNMVEVYVNYLRNKIDRDFSPRLIHTQFGMGYILKE